MIRLSICIIKSFLSLKKTNKYIIGDASVKKKVLIIVTCVIALAGVVTSICIYRHYHPTHWRYNDGFIIGSTEKQIVEKYGEFDGQKGSSGNVKSYMIRDNTPELIMSKDDSLWYDITFKDGVAVKVELREGYIGG